MSIYQISGLPGVGKTSVEQKLIELGYDTINTDEAWGYYGNLETEEPVDYPEQPSVEWSKTNGFIWNSTAARRQLLAFPTDKPLFICGGSRNEAKLYDLFTKIFVLHISDELREERLRVRGVPRQNTQLFIERMRAYNADTYDHAARIGGIVIESDHGIDAAVEEIMRYAQAS